MSELQALVDALAAELGSPVDVDDRQYRALAYSSHADPVDPVRLASILQREAPREVTGWLESLGIRDAREPVHVPANPALRMAARVCLPIRFDDTLLGYLWLIEQPAPLTAAQLDAAERCARELAVELARSRQLERGDREHEDALLHELLSGEDTAKAAAARLIDTGALAAAPSYAVAVVQAVHGGREALTDAVRVRLAAGVDLVRRAVVPHQLLTLPDGGPIAVVLACTAAGDADDGAGRLLEAAEQALTGSPGWSAAVGLGAQRDAVHELRGSHAEALHALRVARVVEAFAPLARWEELGAYRTIAGLLDDADPQASLPEPLRRLLACAEAATLVPSLECYLDLGGDARSAAERLHLHRSSLYGRLHRIEEIADVDLRTGEDRLGLHLGLRLWRLGGGALPA